MSTQQVEFHTISSRTLSSYKWCFKITCLTKVISKLDKTNGVRTSVTTNPNWTFRIDTNSLYHGLMRDTQFKQGFESYVRRTESLDLLLA